MSKSIIGYYSEPLSLQERTEVVDIMHPVVAAELYRTFITYVEIKAGSIFNKYKDGVLDTMVLDQMTEELITQLREEYYYSHILDYIKSSLSWDDLSGMKMILSSNNACIWEIGDKLRSLYLVGIKPQTKDLEVTPYFIDRCNAYLVDNPDKRIFDKSQLALQIDSVNFDILRKLNKHGYQSETSSPIYDFSDEIRSIFKTVQ